LLANFDHPESGRRLGRLIGQSQSALPTPGSQDIVVIEHLDLVGIRVLEICNFKHGILVFGQGVSANHGTHVGYSPTVIVEQSHHLVHLFVLEGRGELILNAFINPHRLDLVKFVGLGDSRQPNDAKQCHKQTLHQLLLRL
jgi:hypothetical protein